MRDDDDDGHGGRQRAVILLCCRPSGRDQLVRAMDGGARNALGRVREVDHFRWRLLRHRSDGGGSASAWCRTLIINGNRRLHWLRVTTIWAIRFSIEKEKQPWITIHNSIIILNMPGQFFSLTKHCSTYPLLHLLFGDPVNILSCRSISNRTFESIYLQYGFMKKRSSPTNLIQRIFH